MWSFGNDSGLGDAFWFSDDTSSNTWVGCMENDEDMPEEDVLTYIRTNNPDLFHRLRGLPLRSTDIPLSFQGQRTLQRLSQKNTRLQPQRFFDKQCSMTVEPRQKPRNTAMQCLRPPTPKSEWLFKETRRRIEHKLENGFSLYQHALDSENDRPLCGFALCFDRDMHSCEINMYYSLECDQLDSGCNSVIFSTGSEVYCSLCFSNIFSDRPSRTSQNADIEAQNQLSLDGIDHQKVLAKANQLCPKLNTRKLDRKQILDSRGYPDHAFNYPSNSPEARRLREHKQYEMTRHLAEVAKYERATVVKKSEHNRSRQRSSSSDPSVLITRPAYMEPKYQRYRKQGLVENWKKKESWEHLSRDQNGRTAELEATTPSVSPNEETYHLQRYCYCRDIDNGGEMLRCSAELCPIGWFHLRCTGLDRLPTTSERFKCYYCSDDSGTFAAQSMLDERVNCGYKSPVPTAKEILTSSNANKATGVSSGQSCFDDQTCVENKDLNTICDPSWNCDTGTLRNKIARWTAVNEKQTGHDYCQSFDSSPTRFTDLSDSGSRSSSSTIRALSNPEETTNFSDDQYSEPSAYSDAERTNLEEQKSLHNTSRTSTASQGLSLPHCTNSPSTITASTSSSLPSPISDLPTSSTAADPEQTSAPSTPPLAPTHKSSKPWGTPINLTSPILQRCRYEKLSSPSPAMHCQCCDSDDETGDPSQENSDEASQPEYEDPYRSS